MEKVHGSSPCRPIVPSVGQKTCSQPAIWHWRLQEDECLSLDVRSSSINAVIGIGIDSTNSNSADFFGGKTYTSAVNVFAWYTGFPGVGFHYGQWIEIAEASNTTTWYKKSQSGGDQRQGGIQGQIWNWDPTKNKSQGLGLLISLTYISSKSTKAFALEK